MTKYQLLSRGNEIFIYEQKTKTVVRKLADKKKAYELRRHLESGGAFAGETPSFFINKQEQEAFLGA